jgi:hypothetical protein
MYTNASPWYSIRKIAETQEDEMSQLLIIHVKNQHSHDQHFTSTTEAAFKSLPGGHESI